MKCKVLVAKYCTIHYSIQMIINLEEVNKTVYKTITHKSVTTQVKWHSEIKRKYSEVREIYC